MATIYLVRHGKAAAGFDTHLDPGLDRLGREQALAAAQELAPLGPMPLYSSPLARARETAQPLAASWDVNPIIETRVAEIPSPSERPEERGRWLRGIVGGRWSQCEAGLKAWRQAMIDCVSGLRKDSVIFSHFIAINVLVGAATGVDELVCFRPDNGSITRIEVGGEGLSLLELGAEGATKIN